MIKYASVKEMEQELNKISSINELPHSFSVFTSKGVLTMDSLGVGTPAGTNNVQYLSREDADTVSIIFESNGNNIKVTDVKFKRV